MSDTLPADTLRTAAERLRELAERAIHEERPQWSTGHTLGSRSPVVVDHAESPSVLIESYAARLEAVNRYVAAMDPALGLALAKWLRETDALHEPQRCTDGPPDCTCTTGCGWCGDEDWPCSDTRNALAVAHHVLEGEPR